MDTKRHAPSVIAKLMGLDELPSQQPFHKRRRVLSDNYLRKIASIGVVEKQSRCGRSFTGNVERRTVSKKVCEEGEKFKFNKHQNVKGSSSMNEAKLPFMKQKLMDGSHLLMDEKLLQSKEPDYVLEEYDLQSVLKPSSTSHEREIGICSVSGRSVVQKGVLKPNFGAVKSAPRSSLSPSCRKRSYLGDTKPETFTEPKIGLVCNEMGEGKMSACNKERIKPRFAIQREFSQGSYRQMKHRSRGSECGVNGISADESEEIVPSHPSIFDWRNQHQISYSSLKGSYLAKEDKRPLSERCKLNKRFQEVRVACKGNELYKHGLKNNINLKNEDGDFCIANGSPKFWKRSEARRNKLYLGLDKDIAYGKDKSREQILVQQNSDNDHSLQETQVIQSALRKTSGEDKLSDDHDQSAVLIKSSTRNAVSASTVAAPANVEPEHVGLPFGSHEQQDSEQLSFIFIEKNGHCSPSILEASTEESSLFSPEEASVDENCQRNVSELPMSPAKGYSPSPNSVLEPPFSEEEVSECFDSVSSDLHGLRMQLQLLKSESEETQSVGSEMVVSSDEDSEGEESKDCINILGLLRSEEGRDFSYLVDVLDEARFLNGNLELGSIETCFSLDCPINPIVFETLEKKYGEQICWGKSERRLLFDRINLGLMEILMPSMDTLLRENSLRKRIISFSGSRELIEEELWMLLVSQEKEVGKYYYSEEALGGKFWCFELADNVDIFSREIENILFDELVDELASIARF